MNDAQSNKKSYSSKPFGKFLLFAIASLLIASCVTFWVAFKINRPNSEAAVHSLPRLPDMSGKPEVFAEHITRADEETRDTIQSKLNAQQLGKEVGRLGEIYQANYYYQHALKCYQIAAELDPKNARWFHHSAYLYQLLGDNESAIRFLERTIELSPDYLPAVLKLADIHYKSGRSKQASEGYEACRKISQNNRYALLGLARIAVDESKWREAQEILERAVNYHPDFGAVNQLLASVYGHFGRMDDKQRLQGRSYIRFEEAPDPWTAELQLYCFDVHKLIAMADKAKQLEDFDRAEKIYKHTLDIAPENANVCVETANLYLTLKHFDDANVYLQKAIKLDPSNPQPYYKSALLLLRVKKQPKEAEEMFLKALSLNKESNTYYYLAKCKYQQKQYREAIEYCKKSLELNLARRSAHYLWGNCLEKLGETEGAIEQYLEELKTDPEFMKARIDAAELLLKQKRLSEAIGHYRRIVEKNTDNISALNILGWTLATTSDDELRNPSDAVQYSKRACELTHFKNPVLLDTLAAAYASSEDFPRAIETSKKAVQIAASSPNQEALLENIIDRMKLYESNQAFVELIDE
jgi:tetratricopeptide (TPR) repeat protein